MLPESVFAFRTVSPPLLRFYLGYCCIPGVPIPIQISIVSATLPHMLFHPKPISVELRTSQLLDCCTCKNLYDTLCANLQHFTAIMHVTGMNWLLFALLKPPCLFYTATWNLKTFAQLMWSVTIKLARFFSRPLQCSVRLLSYCVVCLSSICDMSVLSK